MRLLLALALIAGIGLTAAADAKAPGFVGVRAHDDDDSVPGMSLIPLPRKVGPGQTTIEFHNDGGDDHDLWIKRKGSSDALDHTGALGHNETEELQVKLKKRSRYLLWCALADHQDQGMEATLKVKRR
jgi:uncharacterized cupredoxin-like copper-binding protein